MQNKIRPDFKPGGSTSFSLGLINSCIDGRSQERPAHEVLTQPPGRQTEQMFPLQTAYIFWVTYKTQISGGEVILSTQTW